MKLAIASQIYGNMNSKFVKFWADPLHITGLLIPGIFKIHHNILKIYDNVVNFRV